MSRLAAFLDTALGLRSFGSRDPWVRRALMVVASFAFVLGGFWFARRLQLDPDDVAWPLIGVAALLGVPLTALVNAWEYRVSATLVGQRVPLGEALRISVLGTAANLLPLPGSTLVRIRALRQRGTGYRAAAVVTAALGLVWIGVAAGLVSLLLLLTGGGIAVAAIFGLGALGGLGLGALLLRRSSSVPLSLVRAVLVELAIVAVSALRLALILAALRSEAVLGGAVVLTLSAALAAAAGIFPGGLGLRELVSALLAPVVGLSPAFGFVASALNRVLGILVHAPLAAWLAAHDPDRPDRARSLSG
ncbi:MAG: hypothetical protein ACR2MA_04030 [Egibacteraceae bacterium]